MAMLQAILRRGMAPGRSLLLLPVALAAVLALALIPSAAAAGGRGGAAARGAGISSHGRGRGGRPLGFTLSVFGFGVGLPDLKMPASPIEVKLVTQRVLDPIHYGNYCGPSPEITPATGCRHPLSLAALDESDEVCRLHDHYYCKCESIYTQKGQSPPSSVLIATRSLSSGIRKEYFAKLDRDYTLCIHEADQEMIGRFDRLHAEGRLPTSYWDPVTRWKFDALLEMFRKNLDLDAELLAIQGQETREEGSERWFGEPLNVHMARQKGSNVQAAVGAAGGGSTTAVVAASSSSGGGK